MKRRRIGHRRLLLSARGLRIAVIVSRFHENITARLLNGARECLRRHGALEHNVGVFWCPGAFELPQMAGILAASKRWDAIVCLGAVIRGETAHFEYVAAEAARGIQEVALQWGLPATFGVLTTENERQAKERAGGRHGNKGWDAALAAIEMAAWMKQRKRKHR